MRSILSCSSSTRFWKQKFNKNKQTNKAKTKFKKSMIAKHERRTWSLSDEDFTRLIHPNYILLPSHLGRFPPLYRVRPSFLPDKKERRLTFPSQRLVAEPTLTCSPEVSLSTICCTFASCSACSALTFKKSRASEHSDCSPGRAHVKRNSSRANWVHVSGPSRNKTSLFFAYNEGVVPRDAWGCEEVFGSSNGTPLGSFAK